MGLGVGRHNLKTFGTLTHPSGGLLNIWRRIVVLEVGQSIAAAPLSTAVTKSDLGIFDDCLFIFFTKSLL